MGKENEKSDLMSTLREKSMRDVLTLSLKRSTLGGYKSEDVVAYSKTVMEQWSVCEKNYNDYIKDLYQQIETLKSQLRNKAGEAEDSAIEQRFMLFQDEVSAQLDDLAEQKAELSNQLQSTQNKLQLLNKQFAAQTSELNELRMLRLENERRNDQSGSVPSEAAKLNAQQKTQINDLLASLEKLQAQEAKLLKLIDVLESDKASLLASLEKLQAQETKLLKLIDLLESDKASLQIVIKHLTNQNNNLTSENDAFNEQIAQFQGKQNGLLAEITQLQHANESLNAEKVELQQVLNMKSAETANLTSTNETLHAQIAQFQDLRAENSQFKLQVEELHAQNISLKNTQKLAKTEALTLRAQLESLIQVDSELKNAMEEVKAAAKDNMQEKSDAQINSLVRINAELISTIKALTAQSKEIHQTSPGKDSYQKVLQLDSEKQTESEQLQQLLSGKRSRISQLVQESLKTSIWNEND